MPTGRSWPPWPGGLNWSHDERFATSKARKANAMALVAELESAFGALDFDEIARRLNEADQVWRLSRHPPKWRLIPRPLLLAPGWRCEDGQAEPIRSPAAAGCVPGRDIGRQGPAYPGIGQDTRTVLGELGYSASDIDAMIADGRCDLEDAPTKAHPVSCEAGQLDADQDRPDRHCPCRQWCRQPDCLRAVGRARIKLHPVALSQLRSRRHGLCRRRTKLWKMSAPGPPLTASPPRSPDSQSLPAPPITQSSA